MAYEELGVLNRELDKKVRERTATLEGITIELDRKNVELEKALAELKEAQQAMIRQAKLAALGRMAAGATHEINNPLNFINAGAYGINKKLGNLEKLVGAAAHEGELAPLFASMKELSNVVVNGCDRIKGIVQGLWNISTERESPTETTDINKLLDSTLQLVQARLLPETRVIDERERLPLVECRPQEVGQVFLNLVINALDAMPRGGKLTLKTTTDGTHVHISVQDTGTGIPPDHLGRIFEPFHTTKQAGKGAGLGLTICSHIVEKHGGAIEVESEVGQGSRFTVTLPVSALREQPKGSREAWSRSGEV